jgi:hypothetical protein
MPCGHSRPCASSAGTPRPELASLAAAVCASTSRGQGAGLQPAAPGPESATGPVMPRTSEPIADQHANGMVRVLGHVARSAMPAWPGPHGQDRVPVHADPYRLTAEG